MNMQSFGKRMKQKYKETKKSSIIVYLVLRVLVIICAVIEFIRGNYWNTLLCIFSLLTFTLPTFITKKLKIELPSVLESIIYLFIFSAYILGEINNFYRVIPYWDTILHTLNGFLCAGTGFALIDLLNKNSKSINLSPIYVVIVAFCFSMTVGVCWEFFEFSTDKIIKTDMQKDRIVDSISTIELDPEQNNNPILVEDIVSTEIRTKNGNIITIENGYLDIGLNDTMKDLFVNLIGAVIFNIFGYLYIKNRSKNTFASNFIPKKLEEKSEEIVNF